MRVLPDNVNNQAKPLLFGKRGYYAAELFADIYFRAKKSAPIMDGLS